MNSVMDAMLYGLRVGSTKYLYMTSKNGFMQCETGFPEGCDHEPHVHALLSRHKDDVAYVHRVEHG